MSKRRLLLVKVPYCPHPEDPADTDPRHRNSYRPMPSLALAALSAYFKAHGPRDWEIEAVDLNLAAYKSGETSVVAIEPSELRDLIRDSRYDALGISAPFATSGRWVREAVRASRAYHPKAQIQVGGAYAQTMMSDPLWTAETLPARIVFGEGEQGLVDWFALGHRATTNPDLYALPIPDWSALNVESAFDLGCPRVLPIEASRGCPYSCSYCTVSDVWGKRVGYKSVDQVLAEMAADAMVHGAEAVHFVDDNLSFDLDWFKKFLRAYIKTLSNGFAMGLDASNFSLRHLDAEAAKLMRFAGFERISVAIESGSEKIQKQYVGKRVDLKKAPEQIDMLKEAGLKVHACWMLGFPGETKAQIEETLALAAKIGADSNQFLTVTPYPGTKLYEDAGRWGILRPDFSLDSLQCRSSRAFINQEWDYDWLETRIYDANIAINFMERPAPSLGSLDAVLASHPEHVIALVLRGRYEEAQAALSKPENRFFNRYLDKYRTTSPAVNAFNLWLREKRP